MGVTKLSRAMRSLCEMQLLHFILRRRTTVDCKTFVDISTFLPFKEDVGVAMGIVMKTFLNKLYVEHPNMLDMLPSMFPACCNVLEDPQTALQFWDVIMIIISHVKPHMPARL